VETSADYDANLPRETIQKQPLAMSEFLISDRRRTTHFCHSRFSKAASRSNPDFEIGGLQSSRWRLQPIGQNPPVEVTI
jgi:hypothetical protein